MAGLPLDECGCNSKVVALPTSLSLSLYIYIYIYYSDLFKTDFQVIIVIADFTTPGESHFVWPSPVPLQTP